MTGERYAWPLTDDGPVVNEFSELDRRGQIQMLFGTYPGDHPVYPEFGVALRDSLFESPTQALEVALRVAVREAVHRWIPGVVIPVGEKGGKLVKNEDGKHLFIVNWINTDEPTIVQDPVQLELQNG